MWQEGVRLSVSERPTEMDGRITVRRMTAAVSFTWWSVIKCFSHAQIINAQNHKQAHAHTHTHAHKATLMSANRRKQESTHRRCFIYVDVMPVDMHPARNTAFLTSHTHTHKHTQNTQTLRSHLSSFYVSICEITCRDPGPSCFTGGQPRKPDVRSVRATEHLACV